MNRLATWHLIILAYISQIMSWYLYMTYSYICNIICKYHVQTFTNIYYLHCASWSYKNCKCNSHISFQNKQSWYRKKFLLFQQIHSSYMPFITHIYLYIKLQLDYLYISKSYKWAVWYFQQHPNYHWNGWYSCLPKHQQVFFKIPSDINDWLMSNALGTVFRNGTWNHMKCHSPEEFISRYHLSLKTFQVVMNSTPE